MTQYIPVCGREGKILDWESTDSCFGLCYQLALKPGAALLPLDLSFLIQKRESRSTWPLWPLGTSSPWIYSSWAAGSFFLVWVSQIAILSLKHFLTHQLNQEKGWRDRGSLLWGIRHCGNWGGRNKLTFGKGTHLKVKLSKCAIPW